MKIGTLFVLAALYLGLSATTYAQEKLRIDTMTDDTTITLINPFVVPADKLNETIAMWEQARDFLQTQPGYISTALHQALSPDAQYQLINVAKWESPETFKAATQKMQAEGSIPRIKGVRGGPELYTVARRD